MLSSPQSENGFIFLLVMITQPCSLNNYLLALKNPSILDVCLFYHSSSYSKPGPLGCSGNPP